VSDPKARLDEDERVASEAVAGPWTASGGYITGGEPPNDGDFGEVHILPYAPNEYDPDEKTAAHIARHDPARVLADVERTRRIIAECEYVIRDSANRDTGDGVGLAETILGILGDEVSGQ
jgi:hypothetical protein